MREAVGGSLLFYIMLSFIFIFIVFIAVVMNYAATFRASNYVLTRIEQTEGKVAIGTKNDKRCTGNRDNCTLYSALKSMNYYNDLNVTCREITANGTIIGSVYTITTSVKFEVPLLGVDLPLYINNDTKTIYSARCTI